MADQQETVSGRTGNGERGSGLSGKTQAAADQMKSAVAGQVEQTRQRAESAKAQTAERLRRVAVELRHVSETLQPRDELAARLTERASGGVDRVAGYVSSADLRHLRQDAEGLARARPAMFFGGAFLVGLAIGRFFKSSPARDESAPRPRTQGTSPSLGAWRVEEAGPARATQRGTT
jgi:hypothetical protein